MPCRKSLQSPGNLFVSWVDESGNRILMSCSCHFFPRFVFRITSMCLMKMAGKTWLYKEAFSTSHWWCDAHNLTPKKTFLRIHAAFPETSAQAGVASHLCSIASLACCCSVSFIPSTESQLFSLLWNAILKICQSWVSPGITEGFPHSAHLLQILQWLYFS